VLERTLFAFPRNARNSDSAWPDETAGMGEGVVFRLAGQLAARSVESDQPAAVATTTQMRPGALVEHQVPHHYPACPVARCADHQAADGPAKGPLPIAAPPTTRAFGEPGLLVGMEIMDQRLRGNVAAVAVPGDTIDIGNGSRIGEHCKRRFGLIPVVIPIEQFHPWQPLAQQRPEFTRDEGRTFHRFDPHPGIVGRFKMRLVLDREHVNRHACLAHRPGIADQVMREIAVAVGSQPPLDERSAVLHPRRRAPRRGDDAKLRVDRAHLLERGDQMDSGRFDVRLRPARRVGIGIMAQREIRSADGNPCDRQAEAIFTVEHFLKKGRARLRVHTGLDQPGAGIGDRCAKTGERLITARLVDNDVGRVRRIGNLQLGVRHARHSPRTVSISDPAAHRIETGLFASRKRRRGQHEQGHHANRAGQPVDHARCSALQYFSTKSAWLGMTATHLPITFSILPRYWTICGSLFTSTSGS